MLHQALVYMDRDVSHLQKIMNKDEIYNSLIWNFATKIDIPVLVKKYLLFCKCKWSDF